MGNLLRTISPRQQILALPKIPHFLRRPGSILKDMEFRWIAAVALWTLLSGPVFNGKNSVSTPGPARSKARVVKASSVQPRRLNTVR